MHEKTHGSWDHLLSQSISPQSAQQRLPATTAYSVNCATKAIALPQQPPLAIDITILPSIRGLSIPQANVAPSPFSFLIP